MRQRADVGNSAQLFASVFRDAPLAAAIVALRADGVRIAEVNRRLCIVVALNGEELVGRELGALVHRDDLEATNQALADLEPEQHKAVLARLLDRSGNEVLSQLHIALLANSAEDGSRLALIQVEDVTLRERTLNALRASQKQLQDIVDNVPAMIVTKDLDSRYLLVNRRAFEVAGIRAGDTDFTRFALEDARHYIEADRKVLASNQPIQVEETVWHGSEPHTYLSLKFALQDERDDPYAIGIVATDITKLKRAEAAATDARDEAQSANRAKNEFLSRMSHELRTPLNSIMCYGQLLEAANLPVEAQSNAASILAAGRYVLTLINEILDLSAIEQGVHRMSIEPVYACAPVKEAVDIVRPLAVDRDLRLTCDLHNALYDFVLADRDRLKQVLVNVLTNGVKYNEEGGSLSIDITGDADRIRFLVTDTGAGIQPRDLERIFTPFVQLMGPPESTDGVGLGLAVSKALVEAMNGVIGIERTGVGVGTTFFVELPRCPPPANAHELVFGSGSQLNALASPRDTTAGANLVCIDDDPGSVEAVRQALGSMAGWRVISASGGRAGLALAAEHEPDAILLDLHLSDLPGITVLRRLKADNATREVPVIVISADASAANIGRLRAAGAAHYLTKPLDLAKLVDVVDRFVQT